MTIPDPSWEWRLGLHAMDLDADGHDTTGGSTDLDAIIAASAGEDIADALAGAASPDASNVFATMADIGGSGGKYRAWLFSASGGTLTILTAVDGTPLTGLMDLE